MLEQDGVVTSVHDVKSTCLGPDFVRFKCEILFDGMGHDWSFPWRPPARAKVLV